MTYDVLIAGAGPVGLFLACELRLAGASVLLLEKNTTPGTPLKSGWMGGRGLNAPSTEAFYRRGLLDEVKAASFGWMSGERPGMEFKGDESTPPPPASAPRFAGHFGGIMLDASRVDFSGQRWILPGPSIGGGMVSLEALERVLAERAGELGVEIRMGHEVTGFQESADGVSVQVGDETFQAKWLVGCDGGRSTVRRLAGFEFEGTDPELTGYMAMVEFEDLGGLPPPGFNLTPRGLYTHGPAPGRIGVVDFDQGRFDRTSEITLENLQRMLRHVSGTQVKLKSVLAATSYTDRARQATTYRKGRIFLAGDAAHVHSPFGGQGMNTGLGDAMNLGWKLAAVLRGWAPDDLLETYTAERHPVGEWVLNWTRAQVAIVRPDPYAAAIASVVRDLIATKDGTNYFVEKISGISLHYDLGEGHPLVGYSAPDFELENGPRLGSLLHDGRGLLLDFAANDALQALCEGRQDRLRYLRSRAKDQKGLAALLVRPDGFVAWATDSEREAAGAEPSVRRWFGAAGAP